MKERSFDEMVAYFNRRVSEMDIAQDYKMELLGMVTALGYKHEKTAQPEQKTGRWIPVTERLPEVDEAVLVSYHYDGESEFFLSYDGVTISYWTGVKNHNIPLFADMGDACTILAWMPLPEPYKGGNDVTTD